jgi:hypothetical protein
MKRIESLRGRTVALTGKGSKNRDELVRRIKKKGGIVRHDKTSVTQDTNILVRGTSEAWKHGSYGRKEERAAELIRGGSDLALLLSDGLDKLLQGRAAQECTYVAGHEVAVLRAEAKAEAEARKLPLDAVGTTNVRLEQGALRVHHLGRRKAAKCSVCGCTVPVALLVVAHIKLRSQCTPSEKRDLKHIAMPLCLLGCDVLYERGYITVSDTGKVVASQVSGPKDLRRRLMQLDGRTCLGYSKSAERYFNWHRRNRFCGPAVGER